MQISLPDRNGLGTLEVIEINEPIVLIGANGSGKTRLAFRIYNQQTSYFISAQRLLQLPAIAQKQTFDESFGQFNGGRLGSAIQQQSDYHSVLNVLFAEEDKRDKEYVRSSKIDSSDKKLPIPKSSIDTFADLWKDIMPHRAVEFGDHRVEAKLNGIPYPASEMSDGERVALYLIGKCLIVPNNSLLIIDEPELHLHRALMSRLWNKLEEARPDCQFIYVTHDLDFASSRTKAKKLWIKSFEGNDKWIWEDVPEVDEIPETLVLELIGSRKPILFVEGEKGSYDYEIYQNVYPQFTIIPRGGCEKVIESTKALKSNTQLHTVLASGLIDRDYRTDAQIETLKGRGILFAEVAEIENLLCCPEIIKIVAENQALDPDKSLQNVLEFIMNQLKNDFERQVSVRSALEIASKLNQFNQKALGKDGLSHEVAKLTTDTDVDGIYEKNKTFYQKIIDDNDFVGALKSYTNKGLLPNMSSLLGLKNGEYPKLVLRLLKTSKKMDMVNGLKKYLPEL